MKEREGSALKSAAIGFFRFLVAIALVHAIAYMIQDGNFVFATLESVALAWHVVDSVRGLWMKRE